MKAYISSSNSLTQNTYTRLREKVISGKLKPGSRVNTKELAEDLETNVGAIREALSRLTSENLVIAEPQKGFKVVPVSMKDLNDLTAARILIEKECLRESLIHGDERWESEVISTHYLLEKYSDYHQESFLIDEWNDKNSRFHDALTSACKNEWLLRLQRGLFLQYERYRMLSVSLTFTQRDLKSEHKELMDAAIAKDIPKIQTLIQGHIEGTTSSLLEFFSSER